MENPACYASHDCFWSATDTNTFTQTKTIHSSTVSAMQPFDTYYRHREEPTGAETRNLGTLMLQLTNAEQYCRAEI